MSQDRKTEPLNARQRAFGRELGIAWADGRRDFSDAYAKAGYKPHRGNAARLADDPRVQKIAEEVASIAVKLSGVNLAYLQASALKLLEANVVELHRIIGDVLIFDREAGAYRVKELTDEQRAQLERQAWAMSKLKLGDVTVEITDKRSIIETLLKTVPNGVKDPLADALTGIGDRLDRAVQRAATA
jgi:hypothetical protein